MSKIHLNTECILNVPLQNYDENFIFIVNGKEFKTSFLESDLLSPKISQIHKNDPTFDKFIINTYSEGDFSHFLKILNFNEHPISKSEVSFIIEIVEKLENKSISLQIEDDAEDITIDNVMTNIFKYLKSPLFYSEKVTKVIEFISCHFFELLQNKEEEIKKLDVDILYRIINNEHLQLYDEDQLLKFINSLYVNDRKYSILYETVLFKNLSCESIQEFKETFDYNDISGDIWLSICERLIEKVDCDIIEEKRYKSEMKMRGLIFSPNEHGDFSGIINNLRSQSPNQIENIISVTASSSLENWPPTNLIIYDNKQQFYSKNQPNNWVCFDFKEHRIIPTYYTIRSTNYGGKNSHHHPKNWVIEISNDNVKFDVIDQQNDCSYLNDLFVVHTFKIDHPPKDEVRYIRLRQTGKSWYNQDYLAFDSFEIYGTLI